MSWTLKKLIAHIPLLKAPMAWATLASTAEKTAWVIANAVKQSRIVGYDLSSSENNKKSASGFHSTKVAFY